MVARLLSGSAQNDQQLFLFEVMATFVELQFANDFLIGTTPVESYIIMFRNMKKKVFPNSVVPQPQEEAEEEVNVEEGGGGEIAVLPGGEGKQWTDADEKGLRHRFCANSLLMSSFTEGLSIFAVGTYMYTIPSNPGAVPGSPPLPKSQVVKNTLYMLFGELFITDGIIAWVSAR